MITLKTKEEIEVMREGGKRLARVLAELKENVRAGITTRELDRQSNERIRELGASPAFLGYRPTGAKQGYPATLCTSINEVIVHGTPSEYELQEGDLIKLDLGLIYRGLYVDAAITVGVGRIAEEAKKLIEITEKALSMGVQAAKLSNTLGDIGWAIQSALRGTSFSVVKSLTGHGVGRKLHEDPYVFNEGKPGTGDTLEEGMVLALEPMVAAGTPKIKQLPDESYATADGSLAAHFEHTVAITKQGPLVLTALSSMI